MERERVLVTGGSGFIGVHLVDLLLTENYDVMNIDVKPPVNKMNVNCWKNLSITNFESLKYECSFYNPDYIIHLGATTTQDAKSINEFEVNIEGTKNLLEIANSIKNLKKFIFTSSQYVNSPGLQFSDNYDQLVPYGFYGESKLIGEKLTKEILKDASWTVVRPTTIWGPWHPVLATGLWKQIMKGRYLHPNRDNAIKAYGYVKNTAWQICKILKADVTLTHRKIYYLGDANIHQEKWVSAFVSSLTHRKMRRVPRFALFFLSEFGQFLVNIGLHFPIYRSRYHNLITSNPSHLDDTLKLLGQVPFRFEVGVAETCAWLTEMNNIQNKGFK